MAIQLLPGYNAGGKLGSAFGEGLEGLLKNVIERKTKEAETSRLVSGLRSLFPGRSEQELRGLADLNPALLGSIYKEESRRPGQQAFEQEVASRFGGQPSTAQESAQRQALINPRDLLALGTYDVKKAGQELKEKQFEAAEQKSNIELHKDLIKDYQQKLKEVPKEEAQFKRMDKLIDSGKINFGAFSGPLLALGKASPETQEFKKLIKDQLRDAIQKGVLTDQRAQQLEDSMVSLSQTQQGAKRVMHQLKQVNALKNADITAYKEVLKEHKNKFPSDFDTLVAERKAQIAEPIYRNIVEGFEGRNIKAGTAVSSVDPKNIPVGKKAVNKSGENFFWTGNDWIGEQDWLAQQSRLVRG